LPDQDEASCFAFLADGKTLVTGCRRRKAESSCPLCFYDLASGKEVRRLAGHDTWIYHIALSPDLKRLITRGAPDLIGEGKTERKIRGSICVWDIGSGELLCRQTMKDDWNEISPDGKTW